jgi:hypothetical protein
MTVILETSPIAFTVDGTRCAAWITLPNRPGPHPAVVLVHASAPPTT